MHSRIPSFLAIFSAVPFVVLSLAISFRWVHDLQFALQLLLNYAAIIFSFLGGIHWGLAVSHHQQEPKLANLMLAESTIAFLLAWGIMFIDEMYLRLLMFAFLYAFIWGIDSILFNNKIIPLWFFNLRGVVTPIVVVSMYVAYFSII